MHEGTDKKDDTRTVVVKYMSSEWSSNEHEEGLAGRNPGDGGGGIFAERYYR
jgi:hypothetical protein